MSHLVLADVAPILGWHIRSGAQYTWKAYGPTARFLDFQESDHLPSWNVSLVIDTNSTRIVEIAAYRENDVSARLPCRWIDPDFRSAYLAECVERRINPSLAWDDVLYNEIDDHAMMLTVLEGLVNS